MIQSRWVTIAENNSEVVEALSEHYKFLEQIQWSLITCFLVFFISFVVLHVMALREYRKRRLRVKRELSSIRVDENEGGEAEYLVSILTSRDYDEPTTAITTIHLIGRVFPGRVHDIGPVKRTYGPSIFAPLCHEKIVVKEDINIDPIIGIVIKTNQAGKHPTWNCKSVIVRNLATNDAWFFQIKKEIGFARTIQAVEAGELVTQNFALVRRLRQEWRNGQHVYFGLYFADPLCAYSMGERIYVAVSAHLILMCFTMMTLSITMPYSLSWEALDKQMTKIQREVGGKYGVSAFGLSLEGETHLSVWFEQIFPSALLSALITTMLGFILVLHFREREKYETGFTEMDYVVCTALRKRSGDRRESLVKAAERAKLEDELQQGDSCGTLTGNYPARDAIFEPAPVIATIPSCVLRTMKPAEARAKQRYMFVGGKYLLDPKYADYAVAPIPQAEIQKLGRIQEPGIPLDRKKTKEASSVSSRSSPMELLSDVAIFGMESTDSIFDLYGGDYLRASSNRQVVQPELKLPKYEMKQKCEEINEQLPGEKDPAKFKRPCYQPMSAWIFSILLLAISLFGFALMTWNGPAVCVQPLLFFMIFADTYVLGLFMQNFVFENVKICVVALFYALNDRKTYKLIEETTLMPTDIGFQYQL